MGVGLRHVDKYVAICRAQLNNNLAYPAELAVRSISIILFLFIFAQLWRATYASAGAASIAGLTLKDTLWYLMLAETIILSKPRLSTPIAEAVKDGSVAYLLSRPYSFILYQFSVGLGDSVARLVFNAVAGGAVTWVLAGPPPDPRGWPLALIGIAGAWLIDFTLSAMIGLAAFVAEDVAAFEWIYSKLLMILGGLLIPLDLFPGWLSSLVGYLPFAYTIYGPARLFVDPNLQRFAGLLAGQILWILVLATLLAAMYRWGVARLTINGG